MNMNSIKKFFQKIKKWYFALPDKKRHIELITAALSVPMMLTVILVNLNNIKSQNKAPATSTITTTPIQVVIDNPTATNSTEVNPNSTTSPILTASPTKTECKKEIGPIEILSPQEDEIISTDNVCINISTDSKYCPVTWSYRLGTDNWSDFNNNDICLYNLTAGKKNLQIKIKSTVTDKIITLERTFTYKNSTTPTPTVVNSSTTPANTQ